MKKATTSIFIFIIAVQFSIAQSKLRYEHFTTEDGLSSNFIHSIVSDSAGYIWIGTSSGLNRYDGNSFRIFQHNDHDTTSLPDDYINKLYQDHSGTMWVGTRNGLSRYDPIKENFISFFTARKNSPNKISLNILNICEDGKGNFWLGTTEGVRIFNPSSGTLRKFSPTDDTTKFFSSTIKGMYLDYSGNMWMGSGSGLGLRVVNASTLQPLYPDLRKIFSDTLLNVNAEDFFQTADGTIWIASELGICSLTHQDGIHIFRKPEAIVKNVFGAVSSICASDFGIWFGVYNNEVYSGIGNVDWQTNKVTWYHYDPDDPNNLTWGYVSAIAKDRTGVIWIGTSRGLNKLNPAGQVVKLYKQFPNRRYTSWDNVYAIYKDDNGIIWLGTDGKLLIRYDPLKNNYKEMFEAPEGSEGMYSIVPFGKENILLGTQAQGLLLFNKQTGKSSTLVERPPPLGGQVNEISGVVYDSADQKIWVGWCGAGLMSYDLKTGAKKFYTHDENDPQSISSNQVTALQRSRDGFLWVGTGDIVNTTRSEQGKGLNKFNPARGTFIRFVFSANDSTSLSNNNIHCIVEDAKGGIWVATSDGLNYLPGNGNSFRRIYQKDGLPGNFVTLLQFDKEHKLWIGTFANGLCRYDPETKSFLYFDKKDGLQDLRFNRQSSFMANDGELFFGGIGGFNAIYPDQLNVNGKLPSTSISNILIHGKRDSLTVPDYAVRSLHLKYNQSNLQFFFFCPDYSASEKNIFTYKLDGFDNDWIRAGAEHNAKYTNLKAGSYVFRVKIKSADGLRSGNETLISITIDPPFWQTWWFYSLVIIALAAGVFGFVRLRLQSLRTQKKVLEAKVSQRTEQLQLEKEKVAAEKEIAEHQRARAEQSEKFKQQFLANMSHEIRTPMNAISGMTNLLLQKNPREDQLKYLEGIHKSSNNLIVIINDILDLSKMEAGKIEIEQTDFRPKEVVELVYETMRFKADEKGLNFSIDWDKRIPEILVGDPVRLNQVLTNLAGNAIKFTSKGSVTIKVRLMAQKTSSAIVQFIVSDTGIGIPKDKLEKVFESFTQATSETTRKFGGTGLGLTISKQLIELQGGKISLQSEEGKGTNFSFMIEFPVGSETHLRTAEMKTSSIDYSLLNNLRILIADDNEYNRVVAEDTLRSKAPGIQIVTATNGREVIELLKSEIDNPKFEIILMDVHMPELDGYETTREIRNPKSEIRNLEIPIVALTASVVKSDLEKCIAAGMNGYIPKPFIETQLISGILSVINNEKQTELFSIEKLNEHNNDFSSEKNSSGQVVDLTFLKNFCEGDQQRMKKYIRMFLESIPSVVVKIDRALIDHSAEQIFTLVHSLKPRLQMMGMKECLELALRIETGSRNGHPDWKVLTEAIDQLRGLIDQSLHELREVE